MRRVAFSTLSFPVSLPRLRTFGDRWTTDTCILRQAQTRDVFAAGALPASGPEDVAGVRRARKYVSR